METETKLVNQPLPGLNSKFATMKFVPGLLRNPGVGHAK